MSMEMMDLEDEDGDEDGDDDHADQQVLSKDTHFVATLIVGPGYLSSAYFFLVECNKHTFPGSCHPHHPHHHHHHHHHQDHPHLPLANPAWL